jgi:RsiW-degrading membrane proteinase PrsW (M82 family)
LTVQGLVLVSFTPGLFWLWFFLRLDKYRPEPKRLIAFTFLLGCLSTIPAGIINTFFGVGGLLESDPELLTVAAAMLLVTGPVEEICKFSVVLWVPYRSLYFDEPMDGLVYGATASLGFASLENLFYVLNYGPGTMILRAPISTLAHLVLGSIWGYALGQHHSSGGKKLWLVVISLTIAAAAHALFNVTVFVFPWGGVVLAVAGGLWSFRKFQWGQRISPFRLKRNYPLVECQSCRALIRMPDRFCASCGAPTALMPAALICGRCYHRNRPDASYCTACGDRLLRQGDGR